MRTRSRRPRMRNRSSVSRSRLRPRGLPNNTPNTNRALSGARRAIAAVIASVALGAYACASQHAINIPLMQAHDLTAFLGDRDTAIHSMQAAALMEYTGGGEHF